MGQTDKHIIPVYKDLIAGYLHKKIGMFGFTPDDKLCQSIPKKDCYDLRLKNWDMNERKWNIQNKYAVIVCLRTSGFAKNPHHLLSSFYKILNDKGKLIIDWSLGSDHYPRNDNSWTWGWKNNNHRCYGIYKNKKRHLYSSCLTDTALKSNQFYILSKRIRSLKRYADIQDGQGWKNAIIQEFGDSILNQDDLLDKYNINKEVVWTPVKLNGRKQLYIIHELVKK